MSLTDSRRLWVALRDAGEEGLHSHDIRKRGLSGNPSQRCKDIVSHGQAVWTAREARNGRPGSRFWLADHAPDWAVPVKPNGAEVGATKEPGTTPGADLNVGRADLSTVEDPRTCRRCNGTGQLPSGVDCPSCDGEGLVSRRRRYVESEARAA